MSTQHAESSFSSLFAVGPPEGSASRHLVRPTLQPHRPVFGIVSTKFPDRLGNKVDSANVGPAPPQDGRTLPELRPAPTNSGLKLCAKWSSTALGLSCRLRVRSLGDKMPPATRPRPHAACPHAARLRARPPPAALPASPAHPAPAPPPAFPRPPPATLRPPVAGRQVLTFSARSANLRVGSTRSRLHTPRDLGGSHRVAIIWRPCCGQVLGSTPSCTPGHNALEPLRGTTDFTSSRPALDPGSATKRPRRDLESTPERPRMGLGWAQNRP